MGGHVVTKVHTVNGGYVVEFDDGAIHGIAAYERAEDAIYRWCDSQHVLVNAIHLVCGWDAADELLERWRAE